MSAELRKFLRFECLVPVKDVRLEGLADPAGEGALDNISREGLRLVMEVGVAFSPGQAIDFKVSRSGDRKPVSIRARVVWSRPKGNRFQIGLKILDMDSEAKSELLEDGFERWKKGKPPSLRISKG